MSKLPAQVGDIVTGYQKGFHRVESITPGCGSGNCYNLVRILNSKYGKGKGKSTCDGAYIKKVNKEQLLQKLKEHTQEALDNVEKFL